MGKTYIEQSFEENGSDGAMDVLNKRIAGWTEQREMYTTAAPGLSLFRREEPTEQVSGMYEPSICLAVQVAWMRQVQDLGRV